MGLRRVVVVALALVVAGGCAKESDTPAGSSRADESAGPQAFEDHWHAAFGVYECGEFRPDLPQNEAPTGIHTHGDGAIHIHPFSEDGAGSNATLEAFLDFTDVELDGGTECDGDLQIAWWEDLDGEPTIVDDPADVHFSADQQAVTVAFVPEGEDIPQPPSTDDLGELGAADARSGGDLPITIPEPVDSADDVDDGFYAVLSAAPPDQGCGAGPGIVSGVDVEECFVLDLDSALSTDIVESAAVDRSQAFDQISLVLTEDGIDAFNDLASACYNASDQAICPTSRIAIVVGGVVITAPTITEPSYERDQISISGGDDLDLESVADALEN